MRIGRYQWYTLAFMLFLGTVAIVVDVVLLRDGIEDNTISAVMRLFSRYPFWPYAWGVLAGHCFWHKREKVKPNRLWQFAVLWGVCAALALIGALVRNAEWFEPFRTYSFLVFLFGAVMGRLLWPQYTESPGA